MTQDKCVALCPYFEIHHGKLDSFKALCKQFVERTKTEPECLYYAFTFNENHAHCREGYASAEALLNHLQNVAALLDELRKLADVERLEVHGPAEELDKLRTPLAAFNPQYFVLDGGFRQ